MNDERKLFSIKYCIDLALVSVGLIESIERYLNSKSMSAFKLCSALYYENYLLDIENLRTHRHF